jgi:hypothetical protein
MRPPILPDGPIGSLSYAQLAGLGLRCHIYLRSMLGEEEFARRIAPWQLMFETETRERG